MDRFASHARQGDGSFIEKVGLEFDELEAGQVFEHRPPYVFTFAESSYRARLAGDHAPAAVDPAIAAAIGGGRPVISEAWVLAAFAAVTTRAFGRVVANLGWEKTVMPVPVRDGDVVYAESEILGKRESRSRPDQGILHVASRGRLADGTLVCSFERRLLVYRSGEAGPHRKAGYV
jgi:itaconyl-CoA hydratase